MDKFFATNQVCQSCGLSRSTILRLEDRGLLKPVFIDPKTGVRRYDNNNVAQIMQIKRFLDMGLTYDDVALYYQSGGTSRELLTRIEEQYLRFKRAYEDIKLRVDKREHLSFEFVELPEYVCYAREFHGATVEDSYRAMYGRHREAVEKGYRLGGEQSGHTIFLEHATTGDGQLSALQLLQVLKKSGRLASELAAMCAVYPQMLINVPVADKAAKERIMASDALAKAVAGTEQSLGDRGRVLVRPSGTEALVRVMVEAAEDAEAREMAEALANVIKNL